MGLLDSVGGLGGVLGGGGSGGSALAQEVVAVVATVGRTDDGVDVVPRRHHIVEHDSRVVVELDPAAGLETLRFNLGNLEVAEETEFRIYVWGMETGTDAEGKPVTRVENYCATGSEALRQAAYAVASGAYDSAMAIGVEKVKDSGYQGLNAFPIPTDGTNRTLTAAEATEAKLAGAARFARVLDERLATRVAQLQPTDPMKAKQLAKALSDLAEEGVAQRLHPRRGRLSAFPQQGDQFRLRSGLLLLGHERPDHRAEVHALERRAALLLELHEGVAECDVREQLPDRARAGRGGEIEPVLGDLLRRLDGVATDRPVRPCQFLAAIALHQ